MEWMDTPTCGLLGFRWLWCKLIKVSTFVQAQALSLLNLDLRLLLCSVKHVAADYTPFHGPAGRTVGLAEAVGRL